MNNTNFIKKCKDRSPRDTVNIISDFFIKRGYNIKVDILKPTECGSWGCVVILLSHGVRVMSQNGKGATKEYALASGFAELFERFCNKIAIFKNPFLNEKFMNFNFEKNGYYFNCDEKELTVEEVLENPDTKYWFDLLFTSIDKAKNYLSTQCPNGYYGVPFKEYGTNNIKYYDPRVISMILNSSGLAAGNTLEEALVQGMSEMFEHYVSVNSFKQQFDEYYYIDNSILAPYLQDMIKKIEQTGNSIRIYDLSYNFGLPVCLALMVNRYTYNFHMNFGCAPIFDIAVERTITELYQNKETFLQVDNIAEQKPFDSKPWYINHVKAFSSVSRLSKFPEKIYFNGKEVKQYNHAVFKNLYGTYTNEDFMNFYMDLCKQYNTSIYYINNSPIEDMFAVQIFCPNFDVKAHEKALFASMSEKEKNDTYNYVISQWELVKYMQSNSEDLEQLEQILMKLDETNIDLNIFVVGFLMGADWVSPYAGSKGFKTRNILTSIIQDNTALDQILINEIHPYYQKEARLYCTLYNFLGSSVLTKEQIQKIFDEFHITLPDNFYEKGRTKAFLYNHIVTDVYRKMIESDAHNTFISGMCD